MVDETQLACQWCVSQNPCSVCTLQCTPSSTTSGYKIVFDLPKGKTVQQYVSPISEFQICEGCGKQTVPVKCWFQFRVFFVLTSETPVCLWLEAFIANDHEFSCVGVNTYASEYFTSMVQLGDDDDDDNVYVFNDRKYNREKKMPS